MLRPCLALILPARGIAGGISKDVVNWGMSWASNSAAGSDARTARVLAGHGRNTAAPPATPTLRNDRRESFGFMTVTPSGPVGRPGPILVVPARRLRRPPERELTLRI
jgi:hypothetical protein